jgi:hypothetical protein
MIKVGGGLVGKQRDSATERNNPLPPFPPCPFPWERSFRGRALTTVTGQGRAGLVSVVVGEDQGGRVADDPCLTSFKLNRELILTAPRLCPLLLATVEERKSAGQCEVAQEGGK